jgi:TIR domain
MPIIVISYRRQDSNDIARRIYEQLKANYGEKSVYIDIESIQPSADYRVHIRQTLERALVMLAVIGTEWAGVRADGSVRIFEPDDPVRGAKSKPCLPIVARSCRFLSTARACRRKPKYRTVSGRSAISTR